MVRTEVEGLVAESMEEEVDGGRAVAHAELALKQGADLGPAKRASRVFGRGSGVDPAAELFELIVAETAGPPTTRPVVQTANPLGIVAGDPLLEGPPPGPERLGDHGGGADRFHPFGGGTDREQARGGKLIEAEVVGDVHGMDSLG